MLNANLEETDALLPTDSTGSQTNRLALPRRIHGALS